MRFWLGGNYVRQNDSFVIDMEVQFVTVAASFGRKPFLFKFLKNVNFFLNC